jgi:hypothetical protein
MKRSIPLAIALVMGLLMVGTYYFPWMDGFYRLVLLWSPVIAGFAFFLGILSFLMHHMYKVKRKVPGWGYNLTAITAFGVMLVVGLLPELFPGIFGFMGRLEQSANESVFNWLFANMLVPMEATMFALLAFYIASASFRAFRARNLEATLLLVAAMLIMIGRVPLGEYIYAPFTDIQQWIMEFPNTAAKRAIMIGVGLGMAATALKLMLGIERAWIGRGD